MAKVTLLAGRRIIFCEIPNNTLQAIREKATDSSAVMEVSIGRVDKPGYDRVYYVKAKDILVH